MFKKYNSIENSYRKEFLEKIKRHDVFDKTYVVQEKAHGSNLSFWTTDGMNFKAGKRSGPIGNDEKFYNYEMILDKSIQKFRGLFSSIKVDYPDITQMTIYGEVIGGNYPHKDVEKINDAIKVQKGILYAPSNEFFAFDICINSDQYLNADVVSRLFEQENLLYAKTLFEGSLEDCLQYPNVFQTKIPNQLGLPEISENNCEGVIIKPKEVSYFRNGVRIILKNKNEKWSENSGNIKKVKKDIPLSEKVVEFQGFIKDYVTENRLNNVLSKFGELSIKDFGQLMGEFNRDVITDFTKDYSSQFLLLEKQDQKLIKKSITPLTAVLIKRHFGMIR